MSSSIEDLVKAKLQSEKVKLWLPPYTNEKGEKGEIPEELIHRYSVDIDKPKDKVTIAIESLRCHALQKLAARKHFHDTGIATVRIKIAGEIINIAVNLLSKGHELKDKLGLERGLGIDRIKLICSGRVIDDSKTLQEQKVTHQSLVLALVLSQTEADVRRHESEASSVAATRRHAELLSNKKDGGVHGAQFLEVADQSGKVLDLPASERQALALAMTLHEKGKAAMKRNKHGEALLLYLEADNEFKQCRSDILEAVDNYAILCLDIVWCNLILQNVEHLPDAEQKLRTCDECFRKSYGPNLERLALVRGGTGMEKVLFMRLHLLQAIVAFHSSQAQLAGSLLDRADTELQQLTVNEELMTQVMSMGFSSAEARLGLRVCENNVQLAIAHIMRRKEEREDIRKQEKMERKQKKRQTRLGKTAAGKWVDMKFYDQLISMGFTPGAVAESLRQTNNDLNKALQIIQEQPHLLSLPDPEKQKPHISDEMIAQVVAMGFDTNAAIVALQKFTGNLEQVIEELIKVNGVIPSAWMQDIASENLMNSMPGTSQGPTKSGKEKEQEDEAIADIVPDLAQDEDAHLDVTLEEEAEFLREYKARLQSL